MRNGMRALLMCAVCALAWTNVGVAAAPPITRAYSASQFALELDGSLVGFLSSVEGGAVFADVIKYAGEDYFFKKHLGAPGYRDIRLEFGTGMESSFYTWISGALQGQQEPKGGAIIGVDFKGVVRSRLEFTRAHITEFTIPAADASSKEALRFSLVLTPEATALSRKVGGQLPLNISKPKIATAASFRFSIDGLESATQRVTKVEALTVKLPLPFTGGDGECLKCEDIPSNTPSKIDFPHVIISLPESHAEPVYDWFQEFVIAGNNDDSQEKSGSLVFLTPNLQTPLFTVSFKNTGIFAMTQDKNSVDALPRLLVAMYCEQMTFAAQ